MRIHTSSKGLDPTALVPGEDLVLALDERHGLDAAHGVLAQDHLDLAARMEVDDASAEALSAWRAVHDPNLTIDGVCLPFVWEEHIYLQGGINSIRDPVAVDRALESYGTERVELMDADPHTERAVRAAAARRGVTVTRHAAADERSGAGRPPGVPHLRTGRRTRLLARLVDLGVPTWLRPDCLLFLSYWQLMPLLDRMLATPGERPAIFAAFRPTGASRTLRAARRGGWIGTPGPVDRRRAEAKVADALHSAAEAPRIDVMGLEVGACLHARVLDLARRRAVRDVAEIAVLRRAFGRGRVRTVVLAYDIEPSARLVALLAREAGIHTFVLQHGAVLLPRPLSDCAVAEEVAVWSQAVAPPAARDRARVHVVGYPMPHEAPPTRTLKRAQERPKVVVLGQGEDPYTTTMDARLRLRHYCGAVHAVLARHPRAHVVLRPHPSDEPMLPADVVARFEGSDVTVDDGTDILTLLEDSDLCVGASSTATFQAALVGTPVVVLNLSGFEWEWPLDEASDVPVAHTERELGEWIDVWADGGVLPSRDDLLDALGAHGEDACGRVVELLARNGSPAPTMVGALD